MLPLALAAFVAGAWLLQQQAELPLWWVSALIAAAAAAGLLALLWRVLALSRVAAAPPSFALRALTLASAATLGFAYAAAFAQLRLSDELAFADEGRDLRIVGVVSSLPAQVERGTRFEFEVEQVEPAEVHVPARIALGWYERDARVRPGERWAFTVRLRRPHGTQQPGGFDLELWMLERQLRASGYVRSGRLDMAPQRLSSMVWGVDTAVDRARDALRERLQARLAGAPYGGVLVALVLGDQRAIREADWTLFNQTGIAHLVSISGLHITMIAGLIAALTALLWRRSARLLAVAPVQSAAAVSGMVAALAYCLLAGWGVPAQRTFFMLATVAAAMVLRLGLRPAITLALAAAVVTLLDPWSVVAPGFWLSFGAVAAILLVMSGRSGRSASGWRNWLAEATRVQLAVTLALVPLTVALFQQVSLVSPLANAVAIPLVSLVVTPLALLGGALVMLPEPLAQAAGLCLAVAHALFAWLVDLLRWAAGWPWALVSLPAPPAWATAASVAGIAWLLAPPGWPARSLGAVPLVVLFALPPERPAEDALWVTALDVGQGMAVLVETRAHVLLYDTGPRYSNDADAGARIVLPYLRWRGIARIDTLVVSHLDSDHSGGAASILRGVPVGRVLTSMPADHAALRGGQVQRCADGQRVEWRGGQAQVLHPTAEDYQRPGVTTNALSCVLLVEHGGRRVLLTGDIPAREEALLLARHAAFPVDLITAPHHGSKHSSTAALIAASQPRYVSVQAGYRNRFGHPDVGVVQRFEAVQARVLRSDHHGAVQWRFTRGGTETVHALRHDQQKYWWNQPAPRPAEGHDAFDDDRGDLEAVEETADP